MPRNPCVYILASQPRGTLYIGVTSDLLRRVHEHRAGERSSFPNRYAVHRLVHFEMFDDMLSAIAREKQLKNWRRDWKINLIETGTRIGRKWPCRSASTRSRSERQNVHRPRHAELVSASMRNLDSGV